MLDLDKLQSDIPNEVRLSLEDKNSSQKPLSDQSKYVIDVVNCIGGEIWSGFLTVSRKYLNLDESDINHVAIESLIQPCLHKYRFNLTAGNDTHKTPFTSFKPLGDYKKEHVDLINALNKIISILNKTPEFDKITLRRLCSLFKETEITKLHEKTSSRAEGFFNEQKEFDEIYEKVPKFDNPFSEEITLEEVLSVLSDKLDKDLKIKDTLVKHGPNSDELKNLLESYRQYKIEEPLLDDYYPFDRYQTYRNKRPQSVFQAMLADVFIKFTGDYQSEWVIKLANKFIATNESEQVSGSVNRNIKEFLKQFNK